MPKGLTYADAVKLLGGSGPLLTIADNLLGGVLTVATAGGSDLALSLFDAKAEAVRLVTLITGKISETVRGLGRYDRSRRLQAAHAVLVVAAFFEALDESPRAGGDRPARLTRDEQITVAAGRTSDGDWLVRLLASEIPGPSADRTYAQGLDVLRDWFRDVALRTGVTVDPERAVERYEDGIRRLSVELPEFDVWLRRLESRAVSRGLEDLEAVLLRATSGRDPGRQRAALTAAYRSELDRPVIGGDTGDVEMPTLGAAYIDPLFRVRPAGTGARPAEEEWWQGVEPRGDLAGFLATYLTTPQAADAPMLLLGQPGAGKSSLTRILAARLPPADFLVVRVALREVRAEAEIQNQVEQALRGTAGETVEWAALARDANGAMPVVLLDGFDELLQATGVHQSDYLQRVADFQQREAVLGRPVAVVVTSRAAVADRARLPRGGLAVRLEPFDEPRVERWLETWNATGSGRRPLSLAGLRRLPELSSQPLLLLMLALYDATGNALADIDETLGTGQLYELLLHDFADREVRRTHAGQPTAAMAGLVEAELLRLSVVAFAMFHRLRLWVTTDELDDDLTGLGLRGPAPARDETFRTPISAGQEMVGRFFFIQRARALQDDHRRQTYEFLHATFGEYLVARLVVRAVLDAAARSSARTLRLGPADDDGLLRSLLGFTALSTRTTILPFASSLLRHSASPGIRSWLAERLRAAVTDPQHVPGPYRPVEKRIDHWMATYSFNLMLLTLACGGPVRASELFPDDPDPAGSLRDTALQWRAAMPGGVWLDALDPMTITRGRTADGRRELTVEILPDDAAVSPVEPFWSHDYTPPESIGGYDAHFPLGPALKSMHLGNALSDDVLRHALDPLLDRLPNAVTSFVVHGPDDTESAAHSLISLWLTSALDGPALSPAYDRAAEAVAVAAYAPPTEIRTTESARSVVRLFLRMLSADAHRLPTADVVRLIRRILGHGDRVSLLIAVECLLADAAQDAADRDALLGELLKELPPFLPEMPPEDCLRLLTALPGARSGVPADLLAAVDDRLADLPDPRLDAARARLRAEDDPDT